MKTCPPSPSDIVLLDEIWISVFQLVPFKLLIRCGATVSLRWRELVFESVTSFDNAEDGWLTDAVLRRFRNLLTLRLPNDAYAKCAVTDPGLNRMNALTQLDLDTKRISDEGLRALTNLTSLRLYRAAAAIQNRGLERLCRLQSLHLVDNVGLTDDGLAALSSLTRLTMVRCGKISSDGVRRLSNLQAMALIGRNSRVCDSAMMDLSASLTSLDLTYNGTITDQGLARLTRLTTLTLSYNLGITDAGIMSLSSNLTSLNLKSNRKITNAGVKPLSNLKTLLLAINRHITNDGLAGLSGLTELYLSRNQFVTNDGIAELTGLTSLVLRNNLLITPESYRLLTNLVNVEFLPYDELSDAS